MCNCKEMLSGPKTHVEVPIDRKEESKMNSSADSESFAASVTNEFMIDVILIGEPRVGKTSIVNKIICNTFDNFYITSIAIEVESKEVKYGENYFNLNFIVAPGNKAYEADIKKYLTTAKVLVVVYDIAEQNTLESAKNQVSELVKKFKKKKVILLGNKSDLKTKGANFDEISQFCESQGVSHLEISAKSGLNLFSLIKKIID